MSDFELHDQESAPGGSKVLLDGVQQRFGFLPNIYRIMATSPALLQSYLGASEAFANSSLSATEQQIVLLTVSAANGCDYCVAAHSTVADMSQLPGEITDAIRIFAWLFQGQAAPDAPAPVSSGVYEVGDCGPPDGLPGQIDIGCESPPETCN